MTSDPKLFESFQPVIGQAVSLRPLRPDDAAIELAFVTGLSEATRHNRLLGGAIRITDEYIRRLTEIDWSREAALAAVTMIGGNESLIGVARYVAAPGSRECEFAIVLSDAWQGRGIGRRLMEMLVSAARRRGMQRMVGEILSTNQGMLHLVRRLGFKVARLPNDATVVAATLEL